MNSHDYDRHRTFLLKEADTIQTSKRPGYTRGNEDVLANFKNVAKSAHCSPEQAWVIYFMKHIDAITTFMTQPDLPVSEAPIGRFADAINYLQLGYALYQERLLHAGQLTSQAVVAAGPNQTVPPPPPFPSHHFESGRDLGDETHSRELRGGTATTPKADGLYLNSERGPGYF